MTSEAAGTAKLILIVEDHDKNRKLVRDLLQVKGYRTIETDTGEEGIRLARETRPALVLMDIELPGMNGIEAIRALRADPRTRGIPVVAVTASVMTHQRKQLLDAGFDGYQEKPIDVKAFLETVRQVIERGRPDEAPP